MDDPARVEFVAVVAQRDALIGYLHALGWTVVGIAQVAGMSPSAVGRIISEKHPGGPTSTRL